MVLLQDSSLKSEKQNKLAKEQTASAYEFSSRLTNQK